MRTPNRRPSPDEVAIDGFIDKFDAANAALIRACRAELRRRFPSAHEIVYDNYNFLVFGFSTTGRASDTIVSLAAAANGVGLAFPYCGTRLNDPERIMQGSGSSNRFVRLPDAARLRDPAVARLIDEATALARSPLPEREPGPTVVKSISAKQRPRRAGARV